MELSKLVDHGTERLALRTIMRRLGNGDTTKNTLVNAINKPYIFNEEKDARVFVHTLWTRLFPCKSRKRNGL